MTAGLAGWSEAQQPPTPAGSITGRVVEQGADTPVPDARVTLIGTTTPAPGQFPQPREATSDGDGVFQFDGLEPGAYRLTVQKPGFVRPGSPDVLNPPHLIRIGAGKPASPPLLTLERGAVIAGRVLSPNGQPVTNTRVGAFRRSQRASGGQLMMAASPATTNDLGEFRLHSLPAGDYFVQAGPRPTSPMGRGPSSKVLAPTFYPGTTDPGAAQPLSVGRGVTLNGIEIALLEVPAFSVRGIVVDAAGRPVDNASVMLMVDPSTGVSAMMSGGPGRAQTSADGQFRIEGVAAGVYLASAAAPLVTKSNMGGGVESGTFRGVVGGIGAVSGGVVGGFGTMTETYTRDGVMTTYRFDQSGQVRITVQNGDVTDLRLTADR